MSPPFTITSICSCSVSSGGDSSSNNEKSCSKLFFLFYVKASILSAFGILTKAGRCIADLRHILVCQVVKQVTVILPETPCSFAVIELPAPL